MTTRDVRAPKTSKTGRYTETSDFMGMVRRMQRSAGKRVAMGNPEDLAELAALVDYLREVETTSARALNEAGFSWREIGEAQGVVGNSAWKKYRLHSGQRSRKNTAAARASRKAR
jgi:hypothetical protein